MGGFIVEEQIIGIVCLVFGIGLLTWCARMDTSDFMKRRDPKNKWSYIDSDKETDQDVLKQKARGMILMVIGAGLSMFGLVSFLINIPINK